MKNTTLICVLILLIFNTFSFSQAPQSFKYQAVVRNAAGNPLVSQTVGVRVSLLPGSSTAASVYTEEFSMQTNNFGLINLSIGTGTNQVGSFSSINWGLNSYFIKIELNTGSGYTEMGTSQLLSVPYALFAASGNSGPQGPAGLDGINGQQGAAGIDGIGISNSYVVNDSLYIYLTNNTTINAGHVRGVQGLQGPAGTGLNNKGSWLNGTQYISGDYVFDRSSSDPLKNSMWICQSATSFVSTIQPFSDLTNWAEFEAPAGPQGIQGIQGLQGIQGSQGTAGLNGTNGTDGKTIISGSVNPVNEGTDGDFYINTSTNQIFGPKTGGLWGSGISLVGPQGLAGNNGTNGIDGANGINGLNGKSVLNGNANPTAEGVDGDFYINTSTNQIFGPKISGTWGNGVSLIGSTGPQGIQGLQGTAGTGLTNRGNWASGSSYTNGDYVFDRSAGNAAVNSMWICQTSAFTSATQPYLDNIHWVEFQAPAGPQGAIGATGINGTNGTNGLDGKTILNGTSDPVAQGALGDFYINTASNNIFGPKSASGWGTGVLLVGPQGPAGPAGTYTSGNGIVLNLNVISADFGTSATTVATGNHTHSQLHNQAHSMTSASDHSASNWKLFYSNGSGLVNELSFGSFGQVLSSTGINTAPSWISPVNGTVTSVGIGLPSSVFSNGLSVTTSGTLNASFIAQSANTVFASPDGFAGTPAFRALAANDLPLHNHAWANIINTPSTISGYGITDAVNSSTTISIYGITDQIYVSAGAQNLSANRIWNVGLSTDPVLPGNGSLTFPIGWTYQRPASAVNGMARYNLQIAKFEFFENGAWVNFVNNASGLSGNGLANYIPRFDSNSNLDISLMYQSGNRIGVGTTLPSGRFHIQQDAGALDTEPIFEVKDKTGKSVMVVYKDSVHFWVKDPGSSKSQAKGSFAISGKNDSKSFTNNFFTINADSTRIFTTDTVAGFGVRNIQASTSGNYLRMSPKNYFIGHESGRLVTTGRFNLLVGYNAGQSLNTGSNNTYMGYQSGFMDQAGTDNVFMGYQSGYSNQGAKVMNLPVGKYNTFIGNSAGHDNVQGTYNTFIGHEAGYHNVGMFNAVYEAYTGSWNVFVGDNSGHQNTTGGNNVFLGQNAGYNNTTGNNNIFLGTATGFSFVSGNSNTFIGNQAGMSSGSGSGNTFIGMDAGYSNSGSNNIFIGQMAGYNEGGSSKLVIDNTNSFPTTAFIYGEMDAATASGKYLRLNEKFGVNVVPTYMVHSVDATLTNDNAAVFGSHEVTEGYGVGVEGRGKYRGVIGGSSTTYAGGIIGGYFYGNNSSTSGIAYGVNASAWAAGGTSYGIYASASGGTAYAGYFQGNVQIVGTLSKSAGTFKIDHPQDPENKYLVHSFVESPDMKNVYDGTVFLDANGEAVINLPGYFEVLNKDFRYQLTPIGQQASLFIKKEVQGNQFTIAGGTSGMKVSWQVTGIRQDPYAVAHPIIAEPDKTSDEKGLYLSPELYKQPEGKRMHKGAEDKK